MLMQKATPKMVNEWKKIWNKYRDKLKPNRKTGQELLDFLQSKYSLTKLYDNEILSIIAYNVLNNVPFAEKLPQNAKLLPRAFVVNNVEAGQFLYKEQDEVFKGTDIFVGVDLASGFYHVGGSSFLHDELCAYQGLDEKDIQNYYCVAQYIECLDRFGLLEKVLTEIR